MAEFTLKERSDYQIIDNLKDVRNRIDSLSDVERKLLLQVVKELQESGNSDLIHAAQDTLYRANPPTPQQFLDPSEGWVTSAYRDSLREWVVDDFLWHADRTEVFDIISLYGATRIGKSFLAGLLIMYTIVYMHHLRNVNFLYGTAPTTKLSIFILSFNYPKVLEVYLQPLYQLFDMSERFKQVKFQDSVPKEQYKLGYQNGIVWSKAAISDHIKLTLDSNLQVAVGNSGALSFIGSNILSAFISEISFFVESAGTTEEAIYRLYTDITERRHATVGSGQGSYLSYVYLDTSANNTESKIENEILNNLQHSETVHYRHMKRWEVKELANRDFPKWSRTKETFPVFVGDGSRAAKILESFEVKEYPSDKIENVPVDVRDDFRKNILTAIRNIAGRPTSKETKYIHEQQLIENIFDNPLIKNVESTIIADAGSSPELLIWNQIYSIFFVKTADGRYIIRRAPREARVIGLDLAASNKGDLAGISLGHYEWSNKLNSRVLVYDFSFAIAPGTVGINLQGIENFVYDLVTIGNVPLLLGFIDSALSRQQMQNINRKLAGQDGNGLMQHNSVDTDINDYVNFLSDLYNGYVKAGRNIILKNNFKCLEYVTSKTGKEKIDHPKGSITYEYNGDWENSSCGLNMKDVSDSAIQVSAALKKLNILPSTIYEEENIRMSGHREDQAQVVHSAFRSMRKKM